VTDVLPRWVILPSDPPKLRKWLTARQAEQAAYEPLPPVPDGESS
jgi:hypothetical protein